MRESEFFQYKKDREKEEVFLDSEKAREKIRNFWKRSEREKSLGREIDEIERDNREFFIKSGFEMSVSLNMSDKTKKREGEGEKANEVVIASENAGKNRLFSEILEKLNMKSVFLSEKEGFNEDADQRIFKQLIGEEKTDSAEDYGHYLYAINMAKAKIEQVYRYCPDRTIIASDVVVVDGDRILEKPKNRKEALEILKSLSGKEAKIYCGVSMLTNIKIGKKIFLNEGVNFTVSLRDFSDEEAEEYLDQSGENILGIAGGIDYSDPESQSLFKKENPVMIEPLELKKENKQKVLVSPEILSSFSDYLQGVPAELVEEMIAKCKRINS